MGQGTKPSHPSHSPPCLSQGREVTAALLCPSCSGSAQRDPWVKDDGEVRNSNKQNPNAFPAVQGTSNGAQERFLELGSELGVLSAGAGQGLLSPRSSKPLSWSLSPPEAGRGSATLLLPMQFLPLGFARLSEPSRASVCLGREGLGPPAPSCSGARGAAPAAGGASAAATTDVEVTSMVIEPTAVSGWSLLTLMRATNPEAVAAS